MDGVSGVAEVEGREGGVEVVEEGVGRGVVSRRGVRVRGVGRVEVDEAVREVGQVDVVEIDSLYRNSFHLHRKKITFPFSSNPTRERSDKFGRSATRYPLLNRRSPASNPRILPQIPRENISLLMSAQSTFSSLSSSRNKMTILQSPDLTHSS